MHWFYPGRTYCVAGFENHYFSSFAIEARHGVGQVWVIKNRLNPEHAEIPQQILASLGGE